MNNENVRIYDATEKDIDILTEMETRCFSDAWSRDYFETLIKNPCVSFYIIKINGTPVAYAGITVIIDECEILNVAVLPEYRRKGIGRLLMDHIMTLQSTGVTTFFLEHRESNIPAASLYESLGFTQYDRRRNYYTSPKEDAILRKLSF